MQTSFQHRGMPVEVSKTRGEWCINTPAIKASSRYLDAALKEALPGTGPRELDLLQIRLAQWANDAL
jgi:hypothetical protein